MGMTCGRTVAVYQLDSMGREKMVRDRNRYTRSKEAKPMSSSLKFDFISGHDRT